MSWLKQDGQVATVDDFDGLRRRGTHQILKTLMQLGCATSQIERRNAPRRQNLRDQTQGVPIHHLGSIWTGIDMTMHTALVAAIAEINLKNVECIPA